MNKNRFLILLFLFTVSFIKAQIPAVVVSIQARKGEKLEGVSVFDVDNKNNLIAISKKDGSVTLPLHKRLLFHCLGFNDTLAVLSADADLINLSERPKSLAEVKVKATKFRTLILAQHPDFLPSFSEGLGGLPGTHSQRVCLVVIPKEGFLSSFFISADKEGKGDLTEKTYLILFKEEEGKPGKPLLNERIAGRLDGKHLKFDAEDKGIFLEAGTYFIGCEIFSEKFSASNGQQGQRTYLVAKYRKTDLPELYTGNNLSKWKPYTFTSPFNRKTNFYSFGYQLKLKTIYN